MGDLCWVQDFVTHNGSPIWTEEKSQERGLQQDGGRAIVLCNSTLYGGVLGPECSQVYYGLCSRKEIHPFLQGLWELPCMQVKQGPKRLCVGVGYSGELYAHADSTWRNFWEIEAGCSPPHWGEGRKPPIPASFQLMGREHWILHLTSCWSLQILNT